MQVLTVNLQFHKYNPTSQLRSVAVNHQMLQFTHKNQPRTYLYIHCATCTTFCHSQASLWHIEVEILKVMSLSDYISESRWTKPTHSSKMITHSHFLLKCGWTEFNWFIA